MSVEVCDGCGRVAGEREVYCGACGRQLPGRSPEVETGGAAPPGWLVAPTARDREGPWFEPLPAVVVPAAERPSEHPRGVPAYRVAEEVGRRTATPPPPIPPPLSGVEATASGAAAAVPAHAPALRALLVPLLVVALGSSAAAVALLVLHLLRDR